MRHNLSEINNIIKDRRTIYPEQFSGREVQKEILEQLIHNATWAPTHGMTQPWRFNIFRGKALEGLGEFLSGFYKKTVPEGKFMETKFKKLSTRPTLASAVIAVGMKKDPKGNIEEIEEVAAVSCAIQNMYLTATAYGIGVFWASPKIIYNPKINSFFGLDEADKLLGLIFVGYPKDGEWPKGRRKPIDQCTIWTE